MTKTELIRSDMVTAMKEGNKERKNALSALLNALKNAEIDKRDSLSEDEANAIIKKEMKQAKETFDTAPDSRKDIKDEAEYRMNVYKEYVPADMTEDQISEVIKDVLKELALEQPTMKDKGKIMKILMPKVKGKADGKLVNEVLARMLA